MSPGEIGQTVHQPLGRFLGKVGLSHLAHGFELYIELSLSTNLNSSNKKGINFYQIKINTNII